MVFLDRGERTKTIEIRPIADTIQEGVQPAGGGDRGESVQVTLLADAAYTIGNPSTATVTILDEATDAGALVSLISGRQVAYEAGGYAADIYVYREGPTDAALRVEYGVSSQGTTALLH